MERSFQIIMNDEKAWSCEEVWNIIFTVSGFYSNASNIVAYYEK